MDNCDTTEWARLKCVKWSMHTISAIYYDKCIMDTRTVQDMNNITYKELISDCQRGKKKNILGNHKEQSKNPNNPWINVFAYLTKMEKGELFYLKNQHQSLSKAKVPFLNTNDDALQVAIYHDFFMFLGNNIYTLSIISFTTMLFHTLKEAILPH